MHCDIPSATSSTIHSLTSASTIDSKLDLSPSDPAARKGLLRDSFFDNWRDDAAAVNGLESPEEMQRKDPLATQIWKLYSKTKNHLPNAERMENLTWRMMSMNLRRKELQRLESVLPLHAPFPPPQRQRRTITSIGQFTDKQPSDWLAPIEHPPRLLLLPMPGRTHPAALHNCDSLPNLAAVI